MIFVHFDGEKYVREEKYDRSGDESVKSVIMSKMPLVCVLTTIKFLLVKECIDDAKGLIDSVLKTADDFCFKD